MASNSNGVRILLVGDDGVGKTSLILSLVTEEFPEEVPPRAEEITIPADVTPEKVPTHIVDFSHSDQTEEELRMELELADVVCVVYAVNDEETITRITSYWLPIVFSICGEHTKPVVLVGNKSDLADGEGGDMDKLLAIMDEYPEIETCIECSAYDLKNISELFYYAQKAVLHPTAPLYSHEEQQLTPKCQEGLIRIFQICDMDNDGILSDIELNEFQKRCFKNYLPPPGLQEVKAIIQRNMEEGVSEEGVTLPGFLFLHALFIQKGRQETTWTALRRFGYGDNLELRLDYLTPEFEVDADHCLELSSSGLDFAMELFYKYDQDEDDALNEDELENMVEICESHPWHKTDFTATLRSDEGWITAEGFVAQWILWTYLDHQWTFKMLAEFGYIHGDMENQLSGLRVTRKKELDHTKRKSKRTVYHVYVIGANGVGKTSFLQAFLDRTVDHKKNVEEFSKYSINSIQIKKQEIHIIFEKVPLSEAFDKLMSGKQDSTVFLYDVANADSFSVIAELHKKTSSRIKSPAIFIGNKVDLSSVKQNYPSLPNEYAVLNSPYPLQFFSCAEKSLKYRNLYTKIAIMTTNSSGGGSSEISYLKIAFSIGTAVSLLAGLAFVGYRYVRKGNVLKSS